MKKIYASFTLFFVLFFLQSAHSQFTHPGVLFNTADLDRMKARLTVQPWKSGYEQILNNYQNYVIKGPFQEVGREPDVNRSQYENDMQAAYYLSILWYMTNNASYAQKAIQIINGWATTHNKWSGTTWTGLERGIMGEKLAVAAEILRYTYPGWTATETTNCNNYFLNMYWNPSGPWTDPVNDNLGTGNQGQGQVLGFIAVAIFLNDQAKYDYIINAFRNNYCVSLNRSTLATGQNGETGRDQAHSMLEVQFMTECAELASKQGTDLYGDLNNRLLATNEHWANYNLGNNVSFSPFGPCSGSYNSLGSISRGLNFPVNSLNQINGEYVIRKGLSAPYSNQYLALCQVTGDTFLFNQEAVPSSPAAPSIVQASMGYKEVVINWNHMLGAVTYNVKRSTTDGGPYSTITSGYSGNIYVDTAVNNNIKYYYVVSAVGTNESSNSVQVMAKPQNISFTDTDIGAVPVAGSASSSNGTWTISGSGNDLNNAADQFNFAYAPMVGNGSITVKINSGPQGKVGIMMRNALNPASQFAMVMFDSGSQIRMAYRGAPNDINTYYLTNYASTIPKWLRLTRFGSLFTGYFSADGVTWTEIGSKSVEMNNAIHCGLAVCGRGALRTAVFNHITMKGISPIPTGLSGTNISDTENNLVWTATADAASYNIYRSATTGGPYTQIANGITSLSYNDQGLTKGTYYYVITAINDFGESAASSEVGISPIPNAPVGLAVSAGNGQATLSWDPVQDASGYKIKRSTVNGSNYSTIASVTSTVYNNAPLTNDSTYYYVVTAISTAGESPNSAQVSVVPKINATTTLFWSGAASAAWDLTALNWKKGSASAAYQQGNAVWFDDTAAGNPTITISAAMSPANIIVNNATLNYTLSGSALNGAMSIIKSGTKTLNLNSLNGFTGGVKLNDGILYGGHPKSFGTGTITLNGGLLQLTNNNAIFTNNLLVKGNSVVASGTISGLKSLTYNGVISGSGTVKFVNNSTNNMNFTTTSGGNWSGFTGTLIYDEGGVNKSFAWVFTPALNLENGSLVIQNTINHGTNALTLNAASKSFVGALSQTGSNGTFISIATGGTLSIGNLNQNTQYGGIISGAGGIELTGGNLTLSGDNSYTGTTVINGGRLDVTGSLSGGGTVSVNSGSILGGSGSVGGAVNVNGNGKISLVNQQANIFNIAGNLSLSSGSSMDFELGSPAASDQINLTAGYTPPLSGNVILNLTTISGFTPGTFVLLRGASGIDTTHFTIGLKPEQYDYSLNANNGDLSVTIIAKANQSITFNALSNKTDQDADFAPAAFSSSGLTVVYTSSDTTVAKIVDAKIHILKAGTTTITAHQSGSRSFFAAIPVSNLLMVKTHQTLTLNPITAKLIGDEDFNLNANSSSGLPVTYTSSNPLIAQVIGEKIHIVGAGTVTFTASQGGDSTYAAAIPVNQELTVLPVNINLNYLNTDNNSSDNNIKPDIKLVNNGTTDLNYSEFKIRYWFTAENYAGINTWIDYAEIDSDKIHLNYIPTNQPRNGALGYVEYSFDPSVGTLVAGASSGAIRTRFANTDWSVFNESDDYSYLNSSVYQSNSHITVYRNGVLVWGVEPAPVTPQIQLAVLSQNNNSNSTTNTISHYLQLNNTGNVPVAYSDLSIRYWFTADGTSPLNYFIDHAKLGAAKITGTFTATTTPLNHADTYLEVKINSAAGMLYPLSGSGNIQQRIAKSNWSNFNETNDYSYLPAAPFAANPNITVYYQGGLIYGSEPGSNTSQNLSKLNDKQMIVAPLNEIQAVKVNTIYPNPVVNTYFFIKVTPDLYNKVLQTKVYDNSGKILLNKKLQSDDSGMVRVDLNDSGRLGVYSVIINNLQPLKFIYQAGY